MKNLEGKAKRKAWEGKCLACGEKGHMIAICPKVRYASSSSPPTLLPWTGRCSEVKKMVLLLSHQRVDDIMLAKLSVFTDFVLCGEGVRLIMRTRVVREEAGLRTMRKGLREMGRERTAGNPWAGKAGGLG
jgi:hypothetical protein